MRYKNLVRYNKLKNCDCEHSYEDKMFMDYMKKGGQHLGIPKHQQGDESSWLDSALDFADEYIRKPLRDTAYDAADIGMSVAGNVANIPNLAKTSFGFDENENLEDDLPTQYRINRNPDGSINTDDMIVQDNREMWERNKDVSEKAVELAASEVAGAGIGHGVGAVAKKLKKPAQKVIEQSSKYNTNYI